MTLTHDNPLDARTPVRGRMPVCCGRARNGGLVGRTASSPTAACAWRRGSGVRCGQRSASWRCGLSTVFCPIWTVYYGLFPPFLPRALQPAGQHPFLNPGEVVLIRRQVLLPCLLVPD